MLKIQGWEFALWFFEGIARFYEQNSFLLFFKERIPILLFLKSDGRSLVKSDQSELLSSLIKKDRREPGSDSLLGNKGEKE